MAKYLRNLYILIYKLRQTTTRTVRLRTTVKVAVHSFERLSPILTYTNLGTTVENIGNATFPIHTPKIAF